MNQVNQSFASQNHNSSKIIGSGVPLHSIAALKANSLQKLFQEEDLERHKKRLSGARSSIDANPPNDFPHLKTRAK